ncbi:hypothetical protein BDD12DRAFT_876260 [Trichophaea hybrida]|nr:hypothetical protein BDD12DRAFT_879588 [Trichophaea hybrida]KAF8542465.1 hypothetical protein BDD12DRAFT_876260 [Trichophaea hybrida]
MWDAVLDKNFLASLLNALQILESWTVRIALILGTFFIFPGLFYIVYDCLLYMWRTFAQAVGLFRAPMPPSPYRTQRMSEELWTSTSSSGSASGGDEVIGLVPGSAVEVEIVTRLREGRKEDPE